MLIDFGELVKKNVDKRNIISLLYEYAYKCELQIFDVVIKLLIL